jgi:hypothetical protein
MGLRVGDYHLYITFGDAWAPFGGPPDEDIFLTFGIAPQIFFKRLLQIIGDHEATQSVSPEVRSRIAHLCANRLWSTSSNSATSGFDRRSTRAHRLAHPSAELVQR